MDEESARKMAYERALADGISPSSGEAWSSCRFTDGWLVTLGPADPLSLTGSHHFIVLDTGQVIRESGSMPPFEYVMKHSAAGRMLTMEVDGGRLVLNEDGGVEFRHS